MQNLFKPGFYRCHGNAMITLIATALPTKFDVFLHDVAGLSKTIYTHLDQFSFCCECYTLDFIVVSGNDNCKHMLWIVCIFRFEYYSVRFENSMVYQSVEPQCSFISALTWLLFISIQ